MTASPSTTLTASEKQRRAIATRKAKSAERERQAVPSAFPTVKPHTHPATTVATVYEDDERDFLLAVEEFKSRTGRRFPLHTDILAIVKSLGFVRQVAPIMARPAAAGQPNHYHLSKSRRVKAVKDHYDDKTTAKEVARDTGLSESSAKRVIRLARAFDAEQLEVFEQAGTPQEDMTAIARIADVAKRGEIVALIASGLDTKTAIVKSLGFVRTSSTGSPSGNHGEGR